jgi:hypothetical protein
MTVPVLTEKDFGSLRNSPDVKKHLRFVTPDHGSALGCYLLSLPVWLGAAVFGGYALDRAGLYPGPWLLLVFLAVALVLPLWPLFRVRRHMRRPVLDKLATLVGMDYASHDFEMKAFEPALPMLFGDKAATDFTDLLAGKEGGNSFAVCRADIWVGDEKAFSGLLHWFGRRAKSGAVSVILPPGEAAAARAKLTKKMEKIGTGDAAFQLWSDKPNDAGALLTDALREALSGLAAHGPVYAYVSRNNVFLLASRPPAFEPDDPPADREARLRLIFDNVAAAFATAKAFRDGLV